VVSVGYILIVFRKKTTQELSNWIFLLSIYLINCCFAQSVFMLLMFHILYDYSVVIRFRFLFFWFLFFSRVHIARHQLATLPLLATGHIVWHTVLSIVNGRLVSK